MAKHLHAEFQDCLWSAFDAEAPTVTSAPKWVSWNHHGLETKPILNLTDYRDTLFRVHAAVQQQTEVGSKLKKQPAQLSRVCPRFVA